MITEFREDTYYKSTDGQQEVYIIYYGLLEIEFVFAEDVVFDEDGFEKKRQPASKTVEVKTYIGKESYEFFKYEGKVYKATDWCEFEPSQNC